MTHGSNSAYVGGCRCAECREAARQYLAEHRRQKNQAPAIRSVTAEPPDRRVSGISGMTGSSTLTSSGVKVWCRNCGASDYANKWLVGKSRRIDQCRECS